MKRNAVILLTLLSIMSMAVSSTTYGGSGNGTRYSITSIPLSPSGNVTRGNQPSDIVISPDGSRIYVTAMGTHNIFVIDTAANNIIDVIDLWEDGFYGAWPFRLALTPDGSTIFVANAISDNISVIDTMSNRIITTIAMGHPVHDIVFTPDNRFAYVEFGWNRVSVIDVRTSQVATTILLDNDGATFTLATSHDGGKVYVVSQVSGGARVYVIDVDTQQISDRFDLDIEVTNQGMVSVSPDDSRLYLPSGITGTSYERPTDGVNTVFVIDLGRKSVSGEIAMVGGPIAIRLTPDGRIGYVSTFAAKKVFVVDLSSNAVLGEIEWGDILVGQEWRKTDIRDMRVTPDGSRLYITAWDADAVLVADLTTNRMRTIIDMNAVTTYPYEIAIAPDGKRIYVSSQTAQGGGGTLFVIDTATNSIVERMAFDSFPRNPYVTPDGRLVYLISGNYVVEIDVATTRIIRQISLGDAGQFFYDIAVTPSGEKAYVTDSRDQYVYVVDLNLGSVLKRINVGWWPQMVVVTRDGDRAYVSRQNNPYDAGDLVIIDTTDDRVIGRIAVPVGGAAFGRFDLLAVSPNGAYVYWGTQPQWVNVIEVASNRVVNSIDLGMQVIDKEWGSPRGIHPSDMAFSMDGSRAYIPCGDAFYVVVLDVATGTIIDRIIDVGIEPVAIVVTPDDRFAYVTNKESESVSVIYISTTLPPADTTPPLPPTDLAANGSVGQSAWTNNSSFAITWTNPSDPSGIARAYYKLGSPPTSPTDGTSTSASGFTVTATAQGGQMLYVWLEDGTGNKDHNNRATVNLLYDATAPNDGTLTATAGDRRVDLSWSGFSDEGSGLAGANTYKLVVSTGGFPTAICTSGTVLYQGAATSFAHTGLTNGATYYYRLCARDVAGNASPGVALSVTLPIPTYPLTVTKAGSGIGTVTSSPAGVDCGTDCVETYNSGTFVTLTANPASGSLFTSWTGDCSGTAPACQVTMTQARTATASFNLGGPSTYLLTVTKQGAGIGTVTSQPSGINSCAGTCSGNFGTGSTVTLTATPGSGSTFTGWSEEGCSGTGTCIVTMTQARNVTARFTQILPPPTLSLYDDFSATHLDPARWAAQRDSLRVIQNGSLVLAHSSGASSDNNLNTQLRHVSPPTTLTALQADVTLTAATPPAAGGYSRLRLRGAFYNDGSAGTGSTGDVWAHTGLRVGPTGSPEAFYGFYRCADADCNFTTDSVGGALAPAVVNQPYTVAIARDGSQFTFTVTPLTPEGGNPVSHTVTPALPVAGPAHSGNVILRAEVMSWTAAPGVVEGYTKGTFDNVYINGTLYDDFSSPRIDPAKWRDYEVGRTLENGALVLTAQAPATKNQYTSIRVPNPNAVTDLAADVTLTARTLTVPQDVAHAGLQGIFYNTGTGTVFGDVHGQVFYWSAGDGTVNVHFNTWRSDNAGQTIQLFGEVLATGLALGETHRLRLGWDGAVFTYGVDGLVRTFDPRPLAPVVRGAVNPGREVYAQAGAASGGRASITASVDTIYVNPEALAALPGLQPFRTTRLAGDVTTAGVGLRGTGAGTISLSTLPTNAAVQQAVLYWATLGTQGTFTSPTLNGTPVTGTLIGQGDDPSAGAWQTYAYRADVTSLVADNGSYVIAGLPADGPTVNDTEGASLVVLYTVPGASLRQIAISDGLATLTSARLLVASAPFASLQAIDPTGSTLTLLVGDGQVTSAATRDFAGLNATLLTPTADAFTGSDGPAWDTKSLDARPALTLGATDATAVLSTWGDSLVWVAAILSVPEQIYTLTVIKAGSGSGTVTSAPAGIDCGTDCAESYAANTSVTLTATLATDSIFTGWSDEGCGGTGTCIVSMTQARNVTAIFQRLDMTPPVIVPTVSPAPNGAGWNNTAVSVSWSVTDPESGIPSSSGCGTTTLTADTTGTTLTCAATNGAGLSNSVSVTVKIDKTPPNGPTITVTPPPNAAGWNNFTPVTVGFTSRGDAGVIQSGEVTCTGPTSLTNETAGTTVGGTCTDAAGNTSAAASVTVKIDTTPPVIEAVSNVTSVATSPAGAVVTFALPTATDAVDPSPVVTSSPASGSTFPIGTTTVTVTAKDVANNASTKTFTASVNEPSPTSGRMHGEGRLDQGGKRGYYEFEVWEKATGADRGRLRFSIRALRPGDHEGDRDDGTGRADRFISRMLTDVVFYDLPGLRPGGLATMDTVVFKGIGRWNDADGYAFTATATDAGEPGAGRDSFAITITAPNGTVAVIVSGVITQGNNQSNRVKR